MSDNASIRIEFVGGAGQQSTPGSGPGPSPSPKKDATAAAEAKKPVSLTDKAKGFKMPTSLSSLGGGLSKIGGATGIAIGGAIAVLAVQVKLAQSVVKLANATTDRLSKFSPVAATERARQKAASLMTDVRLANMYGEQFARWERHKGMMTRLKAHATAGITAMAGSLAPEDPFDLAGAIIGSIAGPAGAAQGASTAKGIREWLEGQGFDFNVEGDPDDKSWFGQFKNLLADLQGNTASRDIFTWWQDVGYPVPPEYVYTMQGNRMQGEAVAPPVAPAAAAGAIVPAAPGPAATAPTGLESTFSNKKTGHFSGPWSQ